jgi:hypothetical protein
MHVSGLNFASRPLTVAVNLTVQNWGNPGIFYLSENNAFISFAAQRAYRKSPGRPRLGLPKVPVRLRPGSVPESRKG